MSPRPVKDKIIMIFFDSIEVNSDRVFGSDLVNNVFVDSKENNVFGAPWCATS